MKGFLRFTLSRPVQYRRDVANKQIMEAVSGRIATETQRASMFRGGLLVERTAIIAEITSLTAGRDLSKASAKPAMRATAVTKIWVNWPDCRSDMSIKSWRRCRSKTSDRSRWARSWALPASKSCWSKIPKCLPRWKSGLCRGRPVPDGMRQEVCVARNAISGAGLEAIRPKGKSFILAACCSPRQGNEAPGQSGQQKPGGAKPLVDF